MNVFLEALRVYIPGFVKKRALRELFHLTADAFQCGLPEIEHFSCEALLKEFALFTREQGEKAIRESRNLQGIQHQLYHNAYRVGSKLRKSLHIKNTHEMMLASRIFYDILAIEFQGDANGEIRISSCFFSAYYSSGVCRMISSLDEGVAAGLSGGGKLSFLQRITEGEDCCRARLYPAKDPDRATTGGIR
jgi:hypothetical protein